MSKKGKTIALLIITVLVWGYSALEWIDYTQYSDDMSESNSIAYIPTSSSIKSKPKEESKLILDYRDPFLKMRQVQKPSLPKQNRNQNTKLASTKKIDTETELKWPKIVYSGTINEKLGLLKINGKDYIVKEGEVKDKISIISITLSSINLTFNNERKEFDKK